MTHAAVSLAGQVAPVADRDLELLLTIRTFELLLLDLFAAGKIRGTTHTCLGEEYIPVAVMDRLAEEDFVFSNHRSHGHYLARFRDVGGLLAEIMGRRGAIGNGVGGSQHIYHRRFLSTGIQGELLPVAAGVAMALNQERSRGLAAVFVGDGTWGEGGVYETLNMAQLWSLPLLVLVENNHISQSTPSAENLAGTIAGRAEAFGIPCVEVFSRDLAEIRRAIAGPIADVRERRRPCVIEFHTDRLGPHSKGDDTRPPDELAELKRRDWYALMREADPRRVSEIESRVHLELGRILAEVERAPLSEWSDP